MREPPVALLHTEIVAPETTLWLGAFSISTPPDPLTVLDCPLLPGPYGVLHQLALVAATI